MASESCSGTQRMPFPDGFSCGLKASVRPGQRSTSAGTVLAGNARTRWVWNSASKSADRLLRKREDHGAPLEVRVTSRSVFGTLAPIRSVCPDLLVARDALGFAFSFLRSARDLTALCKETVSGAVSRPKALPSPIWSVT